MDKGLLEKFSGAAAAYSVRLLNRNYTGPLLKIRRVDSVTSQDNGEIFVFADTTGWISLDSKVVDPSHASAATTLGEFVNASGYSRADDSTIGSNPQDAYVVIWKDQSGNANDASQTITTSQPKIVDAATGVNLVNGKPATIQAANALLESPALTLNSSVSLSFVASVNMNSFILSGQSTNQEMLIAQGGSSTTQIDSQVGTPSYYLNGNSKTFTDRADVRTSFSSQKLLYADADFSAWTEINFGYAYSSSLYPMASMSEFIIWNSDQSANRTKIEEDINDAFNIYSVALEPTERSFLGKYPDAAAAYSVRNLTGKSKQPIVKVRRELGVDTDTEETIYANSAGFLDENQLLNFVNEVNEDPRLPLDISEGYGYSLRTVKAGYTGPLIQVRESGGDTTKDFYADPTGKINEQALLNFCGANNGHVSKWYNQGGVDRTLTADAAANQPKIVEAGVVVKDTLNNIALKFTNAGNEFLAIKDDTAFDLQEQCVAMNFMPTALPASGLKRILGLVQATSETFDSSIRNGVSIQATSGNLVMETGGGSDVLLTTSQTVNTPSILTFNFKGGSSSGTSNKITEAATLVANDIKGLSVGARYTVTVTADFLTSEVIQYTSAQVDDNKIEIEASLNKHYKIYGDAYVSTWYDQSLAADESYLLDSAPGAAAAYSLRKLRENYAGKAINVRRDSDQNHLDIGFTSSGELDVDAIINFCGGANGYVTTWYNQAFNSTNELLLDTTEGQGAEAAYSVRQLSSTATECMIIRRASDSKLRTIGFKNKDIDEAEIESFCKGTTCTVQTWKDQSSNGNDATQSDSTKQPTIYTGGALVKENGKVAASIGVSQYMPFDTTITTAQTMAWVGKMSNFQYNRVVGNSLEVQSGSQGYINALRTDKPDDQKFNPTSISISGNNDTTSPYGQDLIGLYHSAYALGTGVGQGGLKGIGYDVDVGRSWRGPFQELIIYSDARSTQRTSIESNINGYYGIYSTNNATQDAQASQPQIYSSSTGVATENGKPAVEFDGSGDNFVASSVSLTQAATATMVAKTNDANINYFFDGDDASNRLTNFQNSTTDGFTLFAGSLLASSTKNTNQNLHFALFNGASSTYHLNSSSVATGDTGSNFADGITIGARYNVDGNEIDGNMQELIFWDSDQSNNRLEIEGNINSHYRIYGSNDASQGTAASQPALVSNGRVIVENGKPAVSYDTSSKLLQSALSIAHVPLSFCLVQSGPATQADITFDLGASGLEYTRIQSNAPSVQQLVVRSVADGIAAANASDDFDQALITVVSKATNDRNIGVNGGTFVNLSTDITTVDSTYLKLGQNSTEEIKQQEIIIWSSDQSANRTGIESSINRAFGIYWDGSRRGLLDDQPNAAAAYSVRALSSSYTGPLVEIRDANGNTQDIYATYNGDLDEAAVINFCTGSTCTISTWYDQSGNSNNATQADALSQPTIYTGGAIVEENGKVAVDFDGSSDYFPMPSGSLPSNINNASGFAVYARAAATSANSHTVYSLGVPNVRWYGSYMYDTDDKQYFSYGSDFVVHEIGPADTQQHIVSNIAGSTQGDARAFLDGALAVTTSLQSGTPTAGAIGASNNTGSNVMDGTIQELVIYHSDKSSDRTSIEENINSYYNIYSKLPGDRLLNKFPGAAAAYSLRVLDSLYSGPLVRVRRDSDNVHADVYPDLNREISGYSKVGVLASSTDPIAAKSNTSLTSFMNGANGFVAVWYDQASSNDASQPNAINQPKIYDAVDGVVVDTQNKPVLSFSGGQQLLTGTMTAASQPVTAISFVDTTNSPVQAGWFYTLGKSQYAAIQDDGSRERMYAGSSFVTGGSGSGANTRRLDFSLFDGANSEIYLNSISRLTGNPGSNGITSIRIGGLNTPNFNGLFGELIAYPTDQSANRTKIETDINNHYSIYAKQKKLLDAYGGAAAAYSLRRLNSLYTGPLVKIRRDSDNVEVNVYPDFEGNFSLDSVVTNVDETTTGSSQVGFSYSTPYATLSQFVKGNPNCFVVEWKDQSGNANHASQIAAASQPKIYDGTTASVVTENGKPAVEFDGSNDGYLLDTTGLDIGSLSSFMVGRMITITDSVMLALSGSTDNRRWYAPFISTGGAGDFNYGYADSSTAISTTQNTNQNLHTMIAGTTLNGVEAFLNSASVGTDTRTTGATNALNGIGNLNDSFYAHCNVQEVVYYGSDQSANRTNIEDNINTFYSIY